MRRNEGLKRKRRRARASALRPPVHLSREAAEIWRRTVADMARNGRLEAIYGLTIEAFCMAVVRQRALTVAIDKAGVMCADGKPNPLLRTVEATATSIKNLAHVLGLTPGSRKVLPRQAPRPAKGNRRSDPWRGVL